jgi:penicillin-binding protein 1A
MDLELSQMLIAVEDRRFWWHPGIDPIGIIRSVWMNVRLRRYAQGGSTITQQVVRMIYGRREKTLQRKLDECWMALLIERWFTKKEILGMYNNSVYMGVDGYGFEVASQSHFKKSVAQLTFWEKAQLVATVRGPNLYRLGTLQNQRRALMVLRKVGLQAPMSPRLY